VNGDFGHRDECTSLSVSENDDDENVPFFTRLFEWLKNSTSSGIKNVKEFLKMIVDKLFGMLDAFTTFVSQALSSLLDKVKKSLLDMMFKIFFF